MREKKGENCYTGYTHTGRAAFMWAFVNSPLIFGPTCPHKSSSHIFPLQYPIHLKKDDFRIFPVIVNGFSVLFDWGKRNNCETWERKFESVEFELIDWGRKGNVSCLLAFQSSADHTLIFREMSKGLVFILTNEIQSAHTFLRDSWEMCFFLFF
jgi:hypothetical protein